MPGPYGSQLGGSPSPGPYGNQLAGHAVGPYGPQLPSRGARGKVSHALGKAITRTLVRKTPASGHVFSTGTHKSAGRGGKPVPDVTPTKPADKNNHAPAVHLPKVQKALGGNYNAPVQGSGFSKQLSRVLGQAFGSLINPGKYANAAANAQYGGVINDLATQIAHAPTDEAQHHADIASWYGKVANQAAGSAGRTANETTAAAGSNDAATKALIDALGGGPAASSVASLGAIQSGGIRGAGQNAANYENQLATAIAGEGAYQQHTESIKDANSLAGLRSQLSQARQNKGNAFATALSNAQGQRFTQLGQLQNMLLGQQLAGPQFAAAALGNAKTRQELQSGDIANQTALAQLQDFQNKANNPTGTFNTLQAPDRAKLGDLITGMFVGKAGRLRQAPKTVGPQVRNYLYNTVGYSKSPETEAFANSIVNSILQGGSGVKGLTRAKEYRVGHRK